MKISKELRDYILNNIKISRTGVPTNNQEATEAGIEYTLKRVKEIVDAMAEDELGNFTATSKDEDFRVNIRYDKNDSEYPFYIGVLADCCEDKTEEWVDAEFFRKVATYMNKILEHFDAKNK